MKKFDHNIGSLVFEKSANFVAENWRKSHKIVIITSTPEMGHFQVFHFFRKLFFLQQMMLQNFRQRSLCDFVFTFM
jgi:hypothetical protein